MTTQPEVCLGCGNTDTWEEFRTKYPDALSCCPERRMVHPDYKRGYDEGFQSGYRNALTSQEMAR